MCFFLVLGQVFFSFRTGVLSFRTSVFKFFDMFVLVLGQVFYNFRTRVFKF